MVGKLSKIPIIFHIQDLISKRYFGIFNLLFNIISIYFPRHIICDGESIKSQLWKKVKNKSTVVFNGVKISDLNRDIHLRSRLRSKFDIPLESYVIGHLARITPWKGQDLLIRSFIKYSEINIQYILQT